MSVAFARQTTRVERQFDELDRKLSVLKRRVSYQRTPAEYKEALVLFDNEVSLAFETLRYEIANESSI